MIKKLEPRHNMNHAPLGVWEDFFTEEELNIILALPEWHKQSQGKVGAGENNENMDKIRKSNISWLETSEKNAFIYNKLSEVVTRVNNELFQFDLTGFYEHAQLTTYTESDKGHYNWHVDAHSSKNPTAFLSAPRKLSMTLLLSDPSEFEGGELQLKPDSDEPYTVEQKRGRAWFFPSYMLHRVTPVTRGVRRSLVLWVGGPSFK